MRALIVGSGYLGRAVEYHFQKAGIVSLSTFWSRSNGPNSVQFDLFRQNIFSVVDLSGIDVVVVTSKIEDSIDTRSVVAAMTNLFRACGDKRVIYVSTDAVFDGESGSYIESDTPNPKTFYSKNKFECEKVLSLLVNDYCVIRSSYIYGYSMGQLDSRLGGAISSICAGSAVPKYVDMFKSPVEVNQLAEIILALSFSQLCGLVHACGTRMSVHDFFVQSIAALGHNAQLIHAEHMPPHPALEYLRDTSLDSTLLNEHFGFKPVSITSALARRSGKVEPDCTKVIWIGNH